LIDDKALTVLIEKLFPLSTVITPNVPEAERIAQMKIETIEEIRKAAKLMQSFGAKNVLIKGGHLPISDLEYKKQKSELSLQVRSKTKNQKPKTKDRQAIDFLFMGDREFTFSADFIETTATHGTGCTFAAAIAAGLANGKTLHEAVESAKKFVTEAIRTAPNLGKGHSPINV
jgi:hydroxymethylpyrimidine/phosphomethylpyrimidine kinase